jgi:phospholipase/carboxylesterase
VLFHGWGESETETVSLAHSLPNDLSYASLRAPYENGRRFVWFASGQPFEQTARWFERWLDSVAASGRPVVLVGFSAGAAFAGGVLLLRPDRYVGAALLCGTLPFDAGVATPRGRLGGKRVFVAHRDDDVMITRALLERAWSYLTIASGARTEARRYEGGHGVSPEMLTDLATWLAGVLN